MFALFLCLHLFYNCARFLNFYVLCNQIDDNLADICHHVHLFLSLSVYFKFNVLCNQIVYNPAHICRHLHLFYNFALFWTFMFSAIKLLKSYWHLLPPILQLGLAFGLYFLCNWIAKYCWHLLPPGGFWSVIVKYLW